MSRRNGRLMALGLVGAIAGCGSGGAGTSSPHAPTSMIEAPATTSPTASGANSSPGVQDIYQVPDFAALETGTYSIEPDYGSPTSPRVLYEVAAEGWHQWIGAFKPEDGPVDRGVAISIAVVTNLVAHGCADHERADPPVGPTVDDLATALTELAPFEVSESPSDVTIYGYRGKHLALTIPDVPFSVRVGETSWTGCLEGALKSWIAPPLSYAFYGYTEVGELEEFWILDVEGTRLMIGARYFPDSPPEDIAEMHAMLDSIQIEP